MRFDTDLLEDLPWEFPGQLFEGPDGREWQCVSREYQSSGRWNENWTSVFRIGDEYWALDFEMPSTEYQGGQGYWGYDSVDLYRVYPHEVTVIEYRKIPSVSHSQ